MSVSERLAEIRERIAAAAARGGHRQDVTVIAVTKTHGPDAVIEAVAAGVPDVGENKVQEALQKQAELGDAAVTARWHLIGHVQSNKVKHLDAFTLCHSVDRASLADAINKFGIARRSPMDVLVQVNVVGEVSKGGYAPSNIEAEGERLLTLAGIRVCGVMAMAPLDASEQTLRHVFASARRCKEELLRIGHPARDLSMGMSGDYEIAVEEGATMVRLGTILFGARGK